MNTIPISVYTLESCLRASNNKNYNNLFFKIEFRDEALSFFCVLTSIKSYILYTIYNLQSSCKNHQIVTI